MYIGKPLNYDNPSKRRYRIRNFNKPIEQLKKNEIGLFIGFDADKAKESQYLFKTYPDKILKYINIEENPKIYRKWKKTIKFDTSKREGYLMTINRFVTNHLEKCIFDAQLKTDKIVVVFINYDGIGFMNPNLLKIINYLTVYNLVDILMVNLQQNNSVRGNRKHTTVKQLYKRYKLYMKTRVYKEDFIKHEIRNHTKKFKMLDNFTYISSSRPMRNFVLKRAA